ncbi:hypothetical protein IVB18_44030 [Bradyrhizobium sp. 186]|uniref:hypothetical protein n=1 Tax=Bradyrhizobium sp. 186 TaxID=2782654 RepID=UPI002001AEA7|nr:hypothetical protein [Bradyrhizobium sp. 186]UPK34893.1 hypothetical protein IVB18_44030 [Bradyrhizobium sp. 186]
MRAICLASAMSTLIGSTAHAGIIDWPAELQHCHALRENIAPLLQAGEGISAARKKIPGAEPR